MNQTSDSPWESKSSTPHCLDNDDWNLNPPPSQKDPLVSTLLFFESLVKNPPFLCFYQSRKLFTSYPIPIKFFSLPLLHWKAHLTQNCLFLINSNLALSPKAPTKLCGDSILAIRYELNFVLSTDCIGALWRAGINSLLPIFTSTIRIMYWTFLTSIWKALKINQGLKL